MEDYSSEEGLTKMSSMSRAQDDAVALDSDMELWVTIDDYGPITLHELITANLREGVTPISHFAASGIRNLEIGGTWEDFGDATILRVAKP